MYLKTIAVSTTGIAAIIVDLTKSPTSCPCGLSGTVMTEPSDTLG